MCMRPNKLLDSKRTCQKQWTEVLRGPKPQSPNPKKNSPEGEPNQNFEDPVSGSKTDPSADDTKNKQGPFLAPELVHISMATGGHANVNGPGCITCGEKRYCKNCEELMQMLGQAWHVRSMTDVAAAWLDKMIARHCHNDLAVEWPARPEGPPHTCGPHCEHNPRPGF